MLNLKEFKNGGNGFLMSEEREITREELYKLVWSKSLVLAAQELGISDVGLAKICKRLDVPRPYRGYWPRIESGHKITIPRLPPAKKDTPASAFISPHVNQEPQMGKQERAELIEHERQPENRIVVPENLRGAHPLVRESRTLLEHGFVGYYSRLFARRGENDNQNCLDIRVTKASLPRALRIMDALIKAIEIRGGKIEIKNQNTLCILNEARVRFSLWEKVTCTERQVAPNERERSYTPDRWLFTPTGELTFKIDEYDVGRKNWKDKPSKPLEEQLNDVMIGLITASRIIRERDLEWERKRQLELEEQQQRAELARLQRIENERREKLNKMLSLWTHSMKLSQFLDECERILSTETAIPPEIDKARWLSWARAYANEINPLTNGSLQAMAQS